MPMYTAFQSVRRKMTEYIYYTVVLVSNWNKWMWETAFKYNDKWTASGRTSRLFNVLRVEVGRIHGK